MSKQISFYMVDEVWGDRLELKHFTGRETAEFYILDDDSPTCWALRHRTRIPKRWVTPEANATPEDAVRSKLQGVQNDIEAAEAKANVLRKWLQENGDPSDPQ